MKRRSRPRGTDGTALIPRRNRRGLIEARRSRARRGRPSPEFPGEIAGASLKPVHPTPDGREPNQFPGEIAGASLKQAALATAAPAIVQNSPAKSPGPH